MDKETKKLNSSLRDELSYVREHQLRLEQIFNMTSGVIHGIEDHARVDYVCYAILASREKAKQLRQKIREQEHQY